MPYLEKLKELKKERNLKNAEIATLSNIPLATVSRIFNGSTPNPTFETISSIATALGASLDEIVGLKEPNEKPIKSRIETTIASYAELLQEKDARINEKDKRIEELKKEKGILAFILVAFLAIFSILLILDIANGNFGYFRY